MSLISAETLYGTIEHVAFRNPENGFTVLKIRQENDNSVLTVVGISPQANIGEDIQCHGTWFKDPNYGMQFKAENICSLPPQSLYGIEKFLSSGLIKGIGPYFARNLIQAFGESVLEVIDQNPERLLQLPGIGVKRLRRIQESWCDQKIIRDIMVFLQSHGIGSARAQRIYKTYGANAIQKVQENPYRLALDVRGFGFKMADDLAMSLGLSTESPQRADAGVRHVLQDVGRNGHCAAPEQQLLADTMELLSVNENIIRAAIGREVAHGRIIADSIQQQPHYFLTSVHAAEQGIAEECRRLTQNSTSWDPFEVEAALTLAEEKTGLQLSTSQLHAVGIALNTKMVIITGGPGVGKTTVVNSLLAVLSTRASTLILCAPTGRAAKRLSETTGREAKTIHRVLEYDPLSHSFRRDNLSPIEAEVVIVDEMSMVDVNLMYALIQAIPDRAALIMVGDVDQLPSVGPGAILSNLIQSHVIPTVRLTEIFRQAQTSQIVMNAHRINMGETPHQSVASENLSDFYWIKASSPEMIIEKLCETVSNRIPQRFELDAIREIQVLTPMNRGPLGTIALNQKLQNLLNCRTKEKITRGGTTFFLHDKVIQLSNNYVKEVFNGDIGFIQSIDQEDTKITVEFDGRIISYDLDECDELALAYATTIHKSQGSEYPAVVIPLSMQHYRMLERNLIYTAVTRGKKLVVVIGEEKALQYSVKRLRCNKRITKLVERLQHSIRVDI